MPSEKRARQRAYREQKRAVEARRKRRRRQLRTAGAAAIVVAVVVVLIVLLSNNPKPKKAVASGKPSVTTSTVAGAAGHAPPTTAAVSSTPVAPVCPPTGPAGAAKRVIHFTAAPPMCISATGVYDATVVTDAGTFVMRMPAAASPAAVNNFVFLARYHYFDGVVFHRVIPGFVVQGGDPTGTGSGGPGYSFTGNTPPKSCTAKANCYPVYSVAMANSSGPSTNGSQFFVVLPGGQTTLDQEPNYTLFGQVVKGTGVVAKIGADGSASGTPKVKHWMEKVTIAEAGAAGAGAPSSPTTSAGGAAGASTTTAAAHGSATATTA